jgi:hypothetical protein
MAYAGGTVASPTANRDTSGAGDVGLVGTFQPVPRELNGDRNALPHSVRGSDHARIQDDNDGKDPA